MRVRTMSSKVVASVVAVIALAAAGTPALAQPVVNDKVAGASPVETIVASLARPFARMLGDPAVTARVGAAVAAGPADLLTIEPNSSFAKAAREANQAVLAAKGLPATVGSLLQVQLAHPDMRAAIARGQSPLVVAATSDDAVTRVTAYDSAGMSRLLDAKRLPDRPTLIIDVNVTKAMSVGLDLVRDRLAVAGLGVQSSAVDGRASGDSTILTGSYYATLIDSVILSDDHEPWVKGDAEIFSIVGSFGLDGKPTIDMVQMPYLNNDNTYYYPYHVLVHWRPDRYLYNFADVVMMEDDGGTNYSSLTAALVSALATISGQTQYVPLVNAIIAAIPTNWWTDDPDYVDSWYTLSSNSTGGVGASGNGVFTFSRIVIDPLSPPPDPGGGGSNCPPDCDA